LADPVGHPFCLYPDPALAGDYGRINRVVFDCFSPRALALFYEEFLDMRTQVSDAPEWVEIAGPTTTSIWHSNTRSASLRDGPTRAIQHSSTSILPSMRPPPKEWPSGLERSDDPSQPGRTTSSTATPPAIHSVWRSVNEASMEAHKLSTSRGSRTSPVNDAE
jgi:hypothetical protein